MSEWQKLTKHENSYKTHTICPYFPKNFTKNLHLCMPSLGCRVKGECEQCTDINHEKEVQCVNPQEDIMFLVIFSR
jgi:hypothetical protein